MWSSTSPSLRLSSSSKSRGSVMPKAAYTRSRIHSTRRSSMAPRRARWRPRSPATGGVRGNDAPGNGRPGNGHPARVRWVPGRARPRPRARRGADREAGEGVRVAPGPVRTRARPSHRRTERSSPAARSLPGRAGTRMARSAGALLPGTADCGPRGRLLGSSPPRASVPPMVPLSRPRPAR